MSEQKFLLCHVCGNMVGMIHDAGVPMVCCGEEMELLKPNTTDASTEKHVPAITVHENNITVNIGSIPHPMEDAHYIEWIYLQTAQGGQRKSLNPGDEPKATFSVEHDALVAAYAYCNLHGLWKTDL